MKRKPASTSLDEVVHSDIEASARADARSFAQVLEMCIIEGWKTVRMRFPNAAKGPKKKPRVNSVSTTIVDNIAA